MSRHVESESRGDAAAGARHQRDDERPVPLCLHLISLAPRPQVLGEARATCLLGVSGAGGIFTEPIIQASSPPHQRDDRRPPPQSTCVHVSLSPTHRGIAGRVCFVQWMADNNDRPLLFP